MKTNNWNPNKKETKITTRELRNFLFNIENQDLTVRELRNLLFEVTNQDHPIEDPNFINNLTK